MLDHNGPGHFGSSFALGFSEPNFVEKTTKPPDEVPDEFKEDVAKLHKPLAAILVGWEGDPLGSPGSFGRIGIRHGGGPGGSLGHPSGGKGEWPPGPGIPGWENGFNVHTLAFTAMRLLQAVRVAASLVGQPRDDPAPCGPVEGVCGGPV